MIRKTLAGYSDRISVFPGEKIAFKVSVEEGPEIYRAGLVRLTCVDDHRDGPGLTEHPVDAAFAGEHTGRRQDIQIGSSARVPKSSQVEALRSFSVRCIIWPTALQGRRQVLFSTRDSAADAGFSLQLTAAGAAELCLGDADCLETGVPLMEREWACIAASYDSRSGKACVVQSPLANYPEMVSTAAATVTTLGVDMKSGGCGAVSLAGGMARDADGHGGVTCDHYNGKIENPVLLSRALGSASLLRWGLDSGDAASDPDVVAAWDFSIGIDSEIVHDISGNRLHGATVNLPARGMKSSRWNGEAQDWKARPDHYAAIHFHDDDLADAGWETDFELTVPEDLPSGVYAARLENGEEPEHVVFYVRTPRAKRTTKVCFLASTATYMAYANYRVMNRSALYEMYLATVPELVPSDLFLNTRPHYGDSLYTEHTDGSGMSIATRLRPIVNMRPNSTLSEFNDDGFLLGWFEKAGIDVDVVTDEDLDREGVGALEGYQCVVTGNHPEYVSTGMWDALQGFLDQGGRLMYLGGNGFYWRIAFHPRLPGVFELRRTEDGNRPWSSEPGEYYMSFTGEYGGLWRRCGRMPNELTGVGFTASGFDVGTGYQRTDASHDPRAAFIFDGLDEHAVIGDFGLIGGGAAGQEIDRYDRSLGSPPHALVLATATGHTDYMVIAKEDMPATNPIISASENPLVRADMTFFETAAGGAVFSVGSMSWIPSLPTNGFDNPVARLTENVVRRFIDPAPFPHGRES